MLSRRFAGRIGFRQTLLFAATGIVIIASSAVLLRAQSTKETLPSFEVASIKPDNSGSVRAHWTPGLALHFSMTNIPLMTLIRLAFGMNGSDLQISGDPNWIHTKRYDIEAVMDEALFQQLRKLPPDRQIHELQLMEQSLLADRFKLKVTHHTKQLPVMKLVGAKNVSRIAQLADQPFPSNLTGDLRATRGPDGEMKIVGTKTTMDVLADALSRVVGRVVENDTEVKGYYTFAISWTDPMQTTVGPDYGPPLQGALEDQLGLKLESTKGPVDTINIDHIEEPSPN